MKVLSVSVTDAGRDMALRLPYQRVHGEIGEVVRARWSQVDAFVLMLAVGAAARIVGPLLTDKERDPAVVCVDETGSWAVALCGGHRGGANALAREVAALVGAQAVVTTATDGAGAPSLDMLRGFKVTGDVAAVNSAILAGRQPLVEVQTPGWRRPEVLVPGAGPERVLITDALVAPSAGVAVLHPASLVVGVGCSSHVETDELQELLVGSLHDAGLAQTSVESVATIDRRRDHDSVQGLGLPVRSFSAEALSRVAVPNPSEVVSSTVGTQSVAEASALLGAGAEAQLVVTKRKSASATLAVARRSAPRGLLSVVGLGPGDTAQRTVAAAAAVRSAELVIGYSAYLDQAKDLFDPSQSLVASPIGSELERARTAIRAASEGRRVAMVCSGDPGVFAMASIVFELAASEAPELEIVVVPGVTASVASASLLGAPLGHDHAVISLSDLLTSWDAIAARLKAVGEADLAVALYNPRSKSRTWQLQTALDILREHRPPSTPVGIVTDAYRGSQHVLCTTLEKVDPTVVGMTSCVIVGSSTTRTEQGRMFTPRGYDP